MVDVRTDYRIGLKDETKKGIASIKKGVAGLDKAFASIGAGLSLAGVTAFTVNAARSADQINKLSDRLGTSTEALSEFGFVAQQSGLEFNTFGTALQRAIRRVADAADETGPAVDALRELGVEANQLKTLAPDQVFEVLAEALSRVEDEYKRVSLAQKIFDSEGVALLQTMTRGAAGVRELREEFRQFGGVVDDATADIGSDLVDSFGRFDAAGQALGNNLLRVLGPTLTDIVNSLANLLPQAAAFSVRAFEGLRTVVAAFARDVLNFVGLEDIARSFDNVAQDAKQNVIQLRDEMEKFGQSTEQAKQAADFLENSLGKFAPTTKQAAAAAKEAAAQIKALADAEREFGQAFDKANQKLAAQEAALLSVATPAEEFEILVARFRREQEDFGISAEVTARRVTDAYERITEGVKGNVEVVSDETKEMLARINSEVDRFSNSIVDSLFDTGKSIEDFFKDVLISIGKLLAKQLLADPFSKLAREAITGQFAGGFANGGFIPPGQFGLVGERGPELAFGGRAGQTISPIASGGVNVQIINNSSAEVQAPQVSQVDGERQIQIVVGNATAANVASGALAGLGFAPPLTRR